MLGKMYQEQRGETTYRALEDLRSWDDMYYGAVIQYIDQYLYSLTEAIPWKDDEVWEMFQKNPQEYITSIKIRDASQNIGNDLKKHFLLGNEERTNLAVTDYIQRKILMGGRGAERQWDTTGMEGSPHRRRLLGNITKTTIAYEPSTSRRRRKNPAPR